jgi:NADH-quinone oxidoreductase subunit H
METILKILTLIGPVFIGIAYLTLAERKVMGLMQRRVGPNIVGPFGLLQPLADGLKLALKQSVLPITANLNLFLIAPVITLTLSLIAWAVIPFDQTVVLADINLGVLYLLAISSLSVYGIICSGWSSNSKYAFLGGLRSSAQMISYEVSIGLVLLSVLVCAGSCNLSEIVLAQQSIWYLFPLFPLFILIFISALAETNRTPFDLPEAEGELVAGYNVEYSSLGFALFFLGEYGNILLLSALISVLFLGGWLSPNIFDFFNLGSFWFGLKICFLAWSIIWVRVAYPRYRYDQLMHLGWKCFLPLSLALLLFIASIIKTFEYYPY